MHKTVKKLSPVALGFALCCYQAIQLPNAQASSLSLSSNANATTVAQSTPAAVGSCLLQGGGQTSAAPEAAMPGTGLGYQSEAIAQLDAAGPSTAPGATSSSTLVAQLSPGVDDCCDVGGTATCEVGGLPVGGAALGAIPLWPLLAIPPGIACAIACTGSNPKPPPVPESPLTGGLVAGFGIMGLWYSRRFRSSQTPSA
ncbi:MAG: hypothetical protein WCD18_03505 [Thermosynechococcaceae cyanobacterium]